MNDDEKEKFSKMWRATMETYGRDATSDALWLAWSILKPYPMAKVRAALTNVLQASRFAPTPADIVGAIQALDGRPGPDEAFAMLPRDECQSAWLTDEMAQAWGVAAKVFQTGDQVAARKSFIEVYTRLVNEARQQGREARWTFSAGTSMADRALALQDGLRRNLVSLERAQKLCPDFDFSTGKPLPALGLTNVLALADQRKSTPDQSATAKKHLDEIRAKLNM